MSEVGRVRKDRVERTLCSEWQLRFSSMSSRVDLNARITRNYFEIFFNILNIFIIILERVYERSRDSAGNVDLWKYFWSDSKICKTFCFQQWWIESIHEEGSLSMKQLNWYREFKLCIKQIENWDTLKALAFQHPNRKYLILLWILHLEELQIFLWQKKLLFPNKET